MQIIKIGGSIITDKTQLATFRKDKMDALSTILQQTSTPYLLIHGAGSFGHVTAKKHQLNEGYTTHTQLQGFSVTHALVQRLNSLVLESLHSHQIPAVGIAPHSILTLNNHQIDHFDSSIFTRYLETGFIPVTYGDVSLDQQLGFSICSGDLLIDGLCKSFHPDRIIFVIDEDGLYNANPKTNPDATLLTHITSEDLSTTSTQLDNHADVTGGMQGKIATIRSLLPTTQEVVLLNGNHPDRLKNALNGEPFIGTHIQGGRSHESN